MKIVDRVCDNKLDRIKLHAIIYINLLTFAHDNVDGTFFDKILILARYYSNFKQLILLFE